MISNFLIFIFAASSVGAMSLIFHEWGKNLERMGAEKIPGVIRIQSFINLIGFLFALSAVAGLILNLLNINFPIDQYGAPGRTIDSFSSYSLFGKIIFFLIGLSMILNSWKLKRQLQKMSATDINAPISNRVNVLDEKTSVDENLGIKAFLLALTLFIILAIILFLGKSLK